MECLDANVVQDLMAGALSSGDRVQVLGHLDTCAECREMLVLAARDSVQQSALEAAHGPVELAATVSSVAGDTGDAALASTLAPDAAAAPRARRREPTPNAQFGRYRMLKKLGSGAMGVVWLAEDPELGRKVALKLLKRPDAALTDRLVREARSMAQVNDPNVVAVYDVGVTDGATYIAMELVQGKSLRQWQTSATSRTIPEILEAYIHAGRGLAAAHRAGLVHLDFKPDNVLVGDDGRIRVTDFGLAAAKPGESGHANPIGDVNLTTSGSVLGTPAYMAPEQFTDGNVDSRTDQFNFCVALYEALYGERPFEGSTFSELGDNVCDGKLKPANDRAPVSKALRAIIVRGLAVKPGDRYPTMDHLLAELGRDRARPFRIAAIAAALLAAVLLLGLGVDYLVRSRGERSVRQAFAATGLQVERAGQLQAKRFQAASALVDQLPPMYELTAHHDEADFGLTSPEHDTKQLKEVHDLFQSASWKLVRELGPGEIAVVDRKGHVVYTSAAPAEWYGGLESLPAISRVLSGGATELEVALSYDEPALVRAKLFGPTPAHGLALMFARAIERNGQLGGMFLQFIDANDVLAGIRLDDDTQLGLVAPDGEIAGDVLPELAAAAPKDGSIAELQRSGATYQVQARPLADATGAAIAHVVMARKIAGVLSLFPHALSVFAGTAFGAVALALAAALRARRITGARV